MTVHEDGDCEVVVVVVVVEGVKLLHTKLMETLHRRHTIP